MQKCCDKARCASGPLTHEGDLRLVPSSPLYPSRLISCSHHVCDMGPSREACVSCPVARDTIMTSTYEIMTIVGCAGVARAALQVMRAIIQSTRNRQQAFATAPRRVRSKLHRARGSPREAACVNYIHQDVWRVPGGKRSFTLREPMVWQAGSFRADRHGTYEHAHDGGNSPHSQTHRCRCRPAAPTAPKHRISRAASSMDRRNITQSFS